jgi:(S)-2-hydroxy-acid oxidase
LLFLFYFSGVDGILVSNHGGRQLDTVPSTIDSLPEVIQAVRSSPHNPNVEVYLDGGIRKGTDVIKALALGAQAVFIGRPMLWGLTVDGAEGVGRVLEILQEEMRVGMTIMGCRNVKELGPEYVRHEREYVSYKATTITTGGSCCSKCGCKGGCSKANL